MIKLRAKRASDGVRCKATVRGKMSKVDLAQEAIIAICSICELAQKAVGEQGALRRLDGEMLQARG